MLCHLFICFSTILICGQTQDDFNDLLETTSVFNGEKTMTEDFLNILKHFQSPDPVGIPESHIPDPMYIPDRSQSFGFSTIIFQNTTVYGISKFRILYVNADIASMKISANMSTDDLEAKGKSITQSLWSSVESPFSVKLHGINVTALLSLGVSRDGKLNAQDIAIEISYKTMSVKFKNGGAVGFIMSSIVNVAGDFLFDSMKPYIMEEAYTKVKKDINKKLDDMFGDLQFPNSISPIDIIIKDIRNIVHLHIDPYKIKDYNSSVGLFSIALYNTYIKGMSSFQRVGNISLIFENNTIISDFEVGTEELEGTTNWEVSALNDILFRVGTIGFSVKYVKGRIVLAQSVDTRKKPHLKELKLDIGNLQIRSDGAGIIDYVLEGIINILPNLLRYQIINALENPIKWNIQKELDEFNVEEVIKQEVPKIDELKRKGFKFSEIRAMQEDTEEDDFFNF